jgi:hypothetical protein
MISKRLEKEGLTVTSKSTVANYWDQAQIRDIRYVQKKMGHRSITSTTIYGNSEPNQDVETYTVKAVFTREEAEKLIALGYKFHYRTAEGVDLFRKKVIRLD